MSFCVRKPEATEIGRCRALVNTLGCTRFDATSWQGLDSLNSHLVCGVRGITDAIWSMVGLLRYCSLPNPVSHVAQDRSLRSWDNVR